MLYSKKYYINLYCLKEVKEQKKYRNFLCIGVINSISLDVIKDQNSVNIYTHTTSKNVHIVTFSNAVRIENKKLWGNKLLVISIKKKFSPKAFREVELREIFQNTTQDIPNFQTFNFLNCGFSDEITYQDYFQEDHNPNFSYGYACTKFSQNNHMAIGNNEIAKLEWQKQEILAEKLSLENEIRFYKGQGAQLGNIH